MNQHDLQVEMDIIFLNEQNFREKRCRLEKNERFKIVQTNLKNYRLERIFQNIFKTYCFLLKERFY